MLEVTLSVTLKFKGPILTHSTAAGAPGIDSAMAQNLAKEYYLPGTLVKGRLRQAWEELMAPGSAFAPRIDEWLGKKAGNTEDPEAAVDPSRGKLFFDDFIDASERDAERIYRIRIDDERGAVSKGAYQVIEAPYASGQEVKFTGTIHFFASAQAEADNIHRCVVRGLRWIGSMGANRTIGFGRLIGVEVCHEQEDFKPAIVEAVGNATWLDLRITPRKEFCIAKIQSNPNLFESDTVIPGGAIKGCIVTTWRTLLGLTTYGEVTEDMDRDRPALCRNFHLIRFTHAFPSPMPEVQRPIIAPLSLVKDQKKTLYDVALCPGPGLFGAEHSAPAFAVDWKDWDDVNQICKWSEPRRMLRVRTAIDRERLRAKDRQLFAYEVIVPDNFVWLSGVDLSRVAETERPAVVKELKEVIGPGLRGLGKTKARADVTSAAKGMNRPATASSFDQVEDLWIVSLQTPAILCDPALPLGALPEQDDPEKRNGLFRAYAEVWRQLSGHSLELVRFFAQQHLAGGWYLHRRFQQGNPYNPFLLTHAGSVFVLKAATGQESDAQQRIKDWLLQGLPLPDWAVNERYARQSKPGNHWTNCPYLPENGYGEINVNLSIHRERRPTEGAYHAI